MQDPPADEREAIAGDDGLLMLASAKEGAGGKENEDLIEEALKQRGKPYIWGGASRGGFDCSGFVCYIYKTMRGMNLPHSAAAQSRLGTPVERGELRAGDLVFFSTYRSGISHVGIYIGENKFIHAANTRKDVRIDTLTGYYHKRYRGARRLSRSPIELDKKELDRLMKESSELPAKEPANSE
ncbi:MAG: C40 family peptidase [Armatimonadota bacterium]